MLKSDKSQRCGVLLEDRKNNLYQLLTNNNYNYLCVDLTGFSVPLDNR